MFAQKRLVSRLALVTLLALAAGCGQEESPTSLQPSFDLELEALLAASSNPVWPTVLVRAGYPWPGTPELAIANVRDAYEDGDATTYASMISPDFRFVLQAETIAEYALDRGVFDASDEIRIFLTMCMGLPSRDGDRITGLEVVQFEPLAGWEPVPRDDPQFGLLANAERCSYRVHLIVDREADGRPWTVRGEVQLVVAPQPVEDTGNGRTAYRLVGGYDKTVRADGTDELLWGSLKALFH
jgi:hypothetical protein